MSSSKTFNPLQQLFEIAMLNLSRLDFFEIKIELVKKKKQKTKKQNAGNAVRFIGLRGRTEPSMNNCADRLLFCFLLLLFILAANSSEIKTNKNNGTFGDKIHVLRMGRFGFFLPGCFFQVLMDNIQNVVMQLLSSLLLQFFSVSFLRLAVAEANTIPSSRLQIHSN